jgi:hypothetical protein
MAPELFMLELRSFRMGFGYSVIGTGIPILTILL